MFTGIIEAIGEVISLIPYNDGKILTLSLPFSEDLLSIGKSIAVNGICLTLTKAGKERGSFYLSQTTLDNTNLNDLKTGDIVNLEHPLHLNQELGGHLLTGHIDATSIIKEIRKGWIQLSLSENIKPYIVPKGSIAIDGISLTVSSMDEQYLWITIIPHTWENTNLKKRYKGDKVNIETDIIAKYVSRLLYIRKTSIEDSKTNILTKEALQLSGFLSED
ncbi:MAG: riboflavin synthase [bacterium]